jgi:hypothetical protein
VPEMQFQKISNIFKFGRILNSGSGSVVDIVAITGKKFSS